MRCQQCGTPAFYDLEGALCHHSPVSQCLLSALAGADACALACVAMSAAVPSPQPTASPPASELLVFIAYRQGAREGDGCAQWLNEKLRGRELSLNATRKAVINTYFAPVSPAIHDWTQKWKGDLRTARAMILVCSPGTAARRAGRDWLYDEIDWWIRHRQTAPILLICDHEGDAGTSVVPARILRRWPLIQRVPWRGASDETTLDRLIEGLRLSETGINYEELRRLRLKNRGLLFLTAVAFLLASVIFLLYRDAQRRRLLDVARALALEAPRQIAPEHRTDERASLLAAHAYLLHARHDGDFLPTIDEAIRAVLAAPAYSMVVEDVPWLRFCADGRTLLMIRDRDVFQPGADESRGLILLDTATGLRRDIPFPYDLSSIACNGLARPIRVPSPRRGHRPHGRRAGSAAAARREDGDVGGAERGRQPRRARVSR